MYRNTRGWPNALSPPSQATVRSSTWMISVGVGSAAVPSIVLLRILYGRGGPHDSDATHAFNLPPGKSREGVTRRPLRSIKNHGGRLKRASHESAIFVA